jgi:hypothetical protein
VVTERNRPGTERAQLLPINTRVDSPAAIESAWHDATSDASLSYD